MFVDNIPVADQYSLQKFRDLVSRYKFSKANIYNTEY